MGFLGVMFGLFLVLMAVQLLVRIVLRLNRRRELAEEWEAGSQSGDRDDFIRAGMRDYDRSIVPRLIWGIVVLPMAGLMILLYVLNDT